MNFAKNVFISNKSVATCSDKQNRVIGHDKRKKKSWYNRNFLRTDFVN